MLKQTFTAICMLLLYAHTLPYHNYPLTKKSSSQDATWVLEKTVDGVEFYYMLQLCSNRTVVFLKIKNTDKRPVEVSWKEIFDTQLEKNAVGLNGNKKITVQPGEILENNCINPKQKDLLIEPEKSLPAYVAIISKFGYKDISVKKL